MSDPSDDPRDDPFDPSLTPAEAPRLPRPSDTSEPPPVSLRRPAVKSPSSATLDLDALLSDVETEVDPGAVTPRPATQRPTAPKPTAPALPAEVASLAAMGALGLGIEAAPPLPPVDLKAEAEQWGVPVDLVPRPEPAAEVAPPLPPLQGEPEAMPAISPAELVPDPAAFEALRRLAGPAGDPAKARTALHAAITGKPYDPRDLPEARAIAIGVARAMAAAGFSVNEMIDAIMAAMME